MSIYRCTYKKKYRSLTNQNLKTDLLLQSLFNFQYAGKCNIFISKSRDKYVVICQGVHFVEDIYLFTPNFYHRIKAESLYQAIDIFNKCVSQVVSSMDWYDPDSYSPEKIYSEIFENNVY